MKFIVKCTQGNIAGCYYLEPGHGITDNRSEAYVYDSEMVKQDKRICWEPHNLWIDRNKNVIIPVGDL